eukprot:TRINITY_DN4697_c0_g1_i1.p1 TRINITY_DN4697_c0_g1~~TRINITY_DN4697_c0_g1_i1.p1  ORF type:complete len:1230 (+),score=403.24 TRINITY_DN4697_c0_g1_i1:31-3720(+)
MKSAANFLFKKKDSKNNEDNKSSKEDYEEKFGESLLKLAKYETQIVPKLKNKIKEKDEIIYRIYSNYLNLENLMKEFGKEAPLMDNKEKLEKIYLKVKKLKEEEKKLVEEEKRREEEEKKKEEEEKNKIIQRQSTTDQNDNNNLVPKKEEIKLSADGVSNRIIKEILDTEKTYVENLRILNKDYLEPLKKNATDPLNKKKLLNPLEFSVLFGNVLVLIQLNESFLSEISLKIVKKEVEYFKGEKPDENICVVRSEISDVFIQFSPLFRMYKNYIANLPEALKILGDLKSRSEPFSKFLLSTINPSVRLTLDDYLIMPMQRIPRYVLLLQQLQKHTEKTDPSYPGISKSIDIFKEVADTLNSSVSENEKNNKMRSIYLQIADYPKDILGNLIQPFRKFVREGELLWFNNDGQHFSIWIILFNDIIMFCIKGDHLLLFREQMNLLDTKITSLTTVNTEDKENTKYLCRISSIGKSTFIIGSASENEKDDWYKAIHGLIEEREKKANYKRIKSKRDLKKLDISLQKESNEAPKEVSEDNTQVPLSRNISKNNLKGLLGPMKTQEFLLKKQFITDKKRNSGESEKIKFNLDTIRNTLSHVTTSNSLDAYFSEVENMKPESELKEHFTLLQNTRKSLLQKISGLEKIAVNMSLSKKEESETVSNQNVNIEIKRLKMTVSYINDREEQVNERLDVLKMMNDQSSTSSEDLINNFSNPFFRSESSDVGENKTKSDLDDTTSEEEDVPDVPLFTDAIDSEESEGESEKEVVREVPQLPINILQRIFLYLQPKELSTCCQVNKEWNKNCSDDRAWKKHCILHFPDLLEILKYHDYSNWKQLCIYAFNITTENKNSVHLSKLIRNISKVDRNIIDSHLQEFNKYHPNMFERIAIEETSKNILFHFMEELDLSESRNFDIIKLLITKYGCDINLPSKIDDRGWVFPIEVALNHKKNKKKVLDWLFSQGTKYLKFIPITFAKKLIRSGNDDLLMEIWEHIQAFGQVERISMEIVKNPGGHFRKVLTKCCEKMDKNLLNQLMHTLYEIPRFKDERGEFLDWDEAIGQTKMNSMAKRRIFNNNRSIIAGFFFKLGASPFVQTRDIGFSSLFWLKSRFLLSNQDKSDTSITNPVSKLNPSWKKLQKKQETKDTLEPKKICKNCLIIFDGNKEDVCRYHPGTIENFENKSSGGFLGGISVYEYKETWNCCGQVRIDIFQDSRKIFHPHRTGCKTDKKHTPIDIFF